MPENDRICCDGYDLIASPGGAKNSTDLKTDT